MFRLFFGDVISILTTVFVLAMLAFVVITFKNRGTISKWGRRILIFILVGTAISALSATRDAYMMESAVFSVRSIQSMLCSIAGGMIFLAGIVSIFIRNQKFRKTGFQIISVLFIIQVLAVEVSRTILL